MKIKSILTGCFLILIIAAFPILSIAQNWQNFTPMNTGSNSLSSNTIYDVITDHNQNIWIAEKTGVCKIENGEWSYFNSSDGLINSRVQTLFLDNYNLLWFATQSGVSYYNGFDFNSYTMDDGLVDNNISSIEQDNNDDYWFGARIANDGTGGGLSQLSGSSFINYTSETSELPNNDIRALCTNDNDIWIGTMSGLAMFDGLSSWTNYTTADGLINDTILSLFNEGNGNIWIGTISGLSVFNGTSFTNYTIDDGLSNNFIYDIYKDNTGIIWVATNYGLSFFNGSEWEQIITIEEEPIEYITSLTTDSDNALFFGTYSSLYKKHNDQYTSYSTFDGGLVDRNTWSIIVGDDNDVWMCGFNGVSRFNGQEFIGYNDKNGLAENYSWTMVKGPDGSIWFGGSSLSKITRYTGNDFIIYDVPGIYSECSYTDKDGNIWFGSYNGDGAIKFDGSEWTVYNDELIQDGVVLSIVDDLDGNMYFSTFTGVVKYDGTSYSEFILPVLGKSFSQEEIAIYNKINEHKGRSVKNINATEVSHSMRDSQGNLWFAVTGEQYAIWNGSEFTTYQTEHGFFYSADMKEDSQGRIWCSQYNAAVDMFDGTNWTTYNSNNGIVENSTVYSIAPDQNDNIWIGYYGNGASFSGVNAAFDYSIEDCESAASFMDKSTSTSSEIVNWEWDFDDPESGTNNISYDQNPDHLFMSNKTNFSVKLKATDALGYSDEITINIEPYSEASVEGFVSSSNGTTITSGYVLAYLLSDGVISDKVDSVQIQNNGGYQFDGLSSCVEYIFRAYPDLDMYESMMPRWHIESFYWFDAVPVSIDYGVSSINNIDIKVFEIIPPPEGTSEVGGGVYYYNSKGEPVKNIDVVLEYDSPDKKSDVIVGFEPTDELGRWSFGELGEGTFKIKVDIPGLSMDSVYTVTISEPDTDIKDLNYYLDPEKGVFTSTTGISESLNSKIGKISIFPNPTSNDLNIQIENKEKLEINYIEIIDMYGNLIRSYDINYSGNIFNKQINIRNLNNGIYFIKIQNQVSYEIRKILIQK